LVTTDGVGSMLSEVLSEFGVSVRGLIHVGAHEGQERMDYATMGAGPVVYVEPIPAVFERLRTNLENFPGHHAVQAVCAEKAGIAVKFHLANNEQSSSLLGLGTVETLLPQIFYEDALDLVTTTVDTIIATEFSAANFNVLVIDTQGAELKVLKGSTRLLETVEVVLLEIGDALHYEGGPTLRELTEFLRPYGLSMKWMKINPHGWGDAIFVHDRFNIQPPPRPQVSGTNLALDKQARQSSVALFDTGATADKAVNGRKTGRYAFCTEHEAEPWWEVDLGAAATLNDLLVFNRIDVASERASELRVLVGLGDEREEVYRHTGEAFGGLDGHPLHVPLGGRRARFLRLQIPGTDYLHLDEVEIYGVV
jgi:FkbM family methyltransferase